MGVTVVLPFDDGYDEARRAANPDADQWPAMIALPRSKAELREAVSVAAANGLEVLFQGDGADARRRPLHDVLLVRTQGLVSRSGGSR